MVLSIIVMLETQYLSGRLMKLDLCSVQQGDNRIISFMSQAIGMMADIDLGTEHLRWMGEARFMVGFLREGMYFCPTLVAIPTKRTVGINRRCPMKLEIKVATQDKEKMVETYRLSRSPVDISTSQPGHTDINTVPLARSIPALQYIDDTEGWTVIDAELCYV